MPLDLGMINAKVLCVQMPAFPLCQLLGASLTDWT